MLCGMGQARLRTMALRLAILRVPSARQVVDYGREALRDGCLRQRDRNLEVVYGAPNLAHVSSRSTSALKNLSASRLL